MAVHPGAASLICMAALVQVVAALCCIHGAGVVHGNLTGDWYAPCVPHINISCRLQSSLLQGATVLSVRMLVAAFWLTEQTYHMPA